MVGLNTRKGQQLGAALGIRVMPTSILVDAEGKQLARIRGSMDADSLRRWLKQYDF